MNFGLLIAALLGSIGDDADWLVGQRNGQEVQLYQLDVEGNRVLVAPKIASMWR